VPSTLHSLNRNMSVVDFGPGGGLGAAPSLPAKSGAMARMTAAFAGTEAGVVEIDSLCNKLCDVFPELNEYKTGDIATSPGVTESGVDGKTNVEFYRTVGALVAYFSALTNNPNLVNVGAAKMSPDQYTAFCTHFNTTCGLTAHNTGASAMAVLLAVHDIGKSKAFSVLVNATLNAAHQTKNHDKVLADALNTLHGHKLHSGHTSKELVAAKLPTVAHLPASSLQEIKTAFASDFHLPQMGQGEIAPIGLEGLFNIRKLIKREAMARYLYHSIFDIAGGGCTAVNMKPMVFVYTGWSQLVDVILTNLYPEHGSKAPTSYVDFYCDLLYGLAPEPVQTIVKSMTKEDKLAALRVNALTRFTVKDPAALVQELLSQKFKPLRDELSGSAGTNGVQTLIYYSPDLVRTSMVVEDLATEKANYTNVLAALQLIFAKVRAVTSGAHQPYQHEVSVAELVKASTARVQAKTWTGADLLRMVEGDEFSLMTDTTESYFVRRA
jgi:hypothetical protein